MLEGNFKVTILHPCRNLGTTLERRYFFMLQEPFQMTSAKPSFSTNWQRGENQTSDVLMILWQLCVCWPTGIRNSGRFIDYTTRHLIWHGGTGRGLLGSPYQLYPDKYFLIGSGQIWTNIFCRGSWDVTFLWKRGIIFRELVIHTKKLFFCILLKHRYIPHINNHLLLQYLFVRPMMTCL